MSKFKPRLPVQRACRYSPHRSQSNGKSNFQIELNNQKFNSNSELNSAYRQHRTVNSIIIFSCDQAALWMVFSVRLSVCPSVCPSVRLTVCPSVRLSHLFDYVPIIVSSWNFQELSHWTRVRSMQKDKVKGQGHRGHDPNFRFRTVTPVWIHIWWWNDTHSLMLLRRGALLFLKVIRQISRSHRAKIAEFDPDWAFPDCNSSLNSPMAMKCCTKLEVA